MYKPLFRYRVYILLGFDLGPSLVGPGVRRECLKPLTETFENLRLRNRWTDFQKTWNVASGTFAHHSLYKSRFFFDLDLFYGKAKFG